MCLANAVRWCAAKNQAVAQVYTTAFPMRASYKAQIQVLTSTMTHRWPLFGRFMTSIVVYHGCSLTFAWLSNVPLIHKQVLQQTFGDIMGSMYETSIGP